MKRYKKLCLWMAGCLLCGSLHIVTSDAAKQSENIDSRLIHLEQEGETSVWGKTTLRWVTEDGEPYEIEPNVLSEKKTKKAGKLPSRYDLRKEGRITEAKNQGSTGACWAYAGIGAAESNLITQGLADMAIDLSELHLLWFAYHAPTDRNDPLYGDGDTLVNYTQAAGDNPFFAGGTYRLVTSTLGRWSGAQKEEDAAFLLSNEENQFTVFSQMADDMETKEEERYKGEYHLQESLVLDDASIEDIKRKLMEDGALQISYYASDSKYYHASPDGMAYYQESSNAADHGVLLAGWDDHFAKENFSSACRPSDDGAWLIRNSWGSEWADGGYFWLSYEEPSIEEIVSVRMEDATNYEHIYQYDGYDIWGAVEAERDLQAANVFTAKGTESLQAVSFQTIADNTPYTIEIYRNLSGSTPSSGTLVEDTQQSGIMQFDGYYTVPLENPVSLKKGEKFAVVITYGIRSTGTTLVPIEYNYPKITNKRVSAYDSLPGQSYLYLDTEWYDLAFPVNGEVYNNLPIKAFTVQSEAAGEEEKTESPRQQTQTQTQTQAQIPELEAAETVIQKEETPALILTPDEQESQDEAQILPGKIKITNVKKKLKKGQKYQLHYKITPTNSTVTKVTFSSSKKKIASITKKGKITAKKKGKTKITVKTQNGKKASYMLTVVKKKNRRV